MMEKNDRLGMYRRIHDISKVRKEMFCQWCNHKEIYEFAKYDQVVCRKCGRDIKK